MPAKSLREYVLCDVDNLMVFSTLSKCSLVVAAALLVQEGVTTWEHDNRAMTVEQGLYSYAKE